MNRIFPWFVAFVVVLSTGCSWIAPNHTKALQEVQQTQEMKIRNELLKRQNEILIDIKKELVMIRTMEQTR